MSEEMERQEQTAEPEERVMPEPVLLRERMVRTLTKSMYGSLIISPAARSLIWFPSIMVLRSSWFSIWKLQRSI